MPVQNLMKDIVINTLDEVLKKEKNHDINTSCSGDIIAYVLNRVPPKYVTSERGLLHGILDSKYKTQERVDVLFLIYEAIEKILKRRDSSSVQSDIKASDSPVFLPHIIGQLLEEDTLSIIPDVEVTLLHGTSPAVMVDSDWDNPYRTNDATRGHYHFWPLHQAAMGKGPRIPFALRFHHHRYIDQAIEISLDIIEKSDFGKSRFIPIVLMKAQ